MTRALRGFAACVLIVPALVLAARRSSPEEVNYVVDGPHRLRPDRHLIDDIPPRDGAGLVHVVVEIPTGSIDKWEVDKTDGSLRWEVEDGAPRQVRSLGYPGNYGMVPRTLLATEEGGDGDPVDVLVLGPAVQRGELVKARLVGVLRMLDDGEKDDKLVAVAEGGPFAAVRELAELERDFVGVTTIVSTWFESYKGPGEITCDGFGDRAEAERVLDEAIATYSRAGG